MTERQKLIAALLATLVFVVVGEAVILFIQLNDLANAVHQTRIAVDALADAVRARVR